MKIILPLLTLCLLLMASSLRNVVAEEWPEDWEDEEEEATELANVRHEEAERFKRLFSISNEFDPSVFEGEVVDFDDDVDRTLEGHGRRLLQAANILDDQNALLQFKEGITLDPKGTLQGWNTSANQDPCTWAAVTCSNVTKRVIGLNLTGVAGAKLIGIISRNISLLSSLMSLTLTWHFLTGPIPLELGNLKNLKLLNLHFNNLSGITPPKLSSCTLIQSLDLNGLLSACPKLESFSLIHRRHIIGFWDHSGTQHLQSGERDS